MAQNIKFPSVPYVGSNTICERSGKNKKKRLKNNFYNALDELLCAEKVDLLYRFNGCQSGASKEVTIRMETVLKFIFVAEMLL